MNLTAEKEEYLIPKMDIVLYEDEGNLYVEFANIYQEANGGFKAEAYKPLSFEGLDVLLKGLQIKKGKNNSSIGIKGILPKELIMYNPAGAVSEMLWICKAGLRDFSLSGQKNKLLFYPHLLFYVKARKIKVYVVKTTNITEDTMIYKAPFPNVYIGNNICWGTVKEDSFFSSNHKTTMENIEYGFFNSRFTTEMMSFNKTKTNTLDLLRKYSKSEKPFPNKELIKIDNFYNVFSK